MKFVKLFCLLVSEELNNLKFNICVTLVGVLYLLYSELHHQSGDLWNLTLTSNFSKVYSLSLSIQALVPISIRHLGE